MAYAVGPAAWTDATRLGYATSGAGPVPRRTDSWLTPKERKRSVLAAFLRGLRGMLMGVRRTSRRQGA